MLKKGIQILYTAWCAIWFVSIMLALSPFIVIPRLISPKLDRVSYFFARVWVFLFSMVSFIHFKTHHRGLIKRGQAYIFTINHTSFLDAPAIPRAIPVPLKGLGKKELANIPLFGFIASSFAVWVDRTNEESRRKSVEKLVRNLNRGLSIMVAPEGTRNNTAEPLLPFYNGPFRLAIETGTPIMPLIIHDAKRLMPKGQLGLKPGLIHNYFLPPIFTENMTQDDLPALKAQVYERMKSKIIELDKQNKR